jgi:integrase
VRVHDLRHSFAAVAAGAGSSLPIIGALLGHTQPQTTARYAHLSADPLKAAAEAGGAHLAAAMHARLLGLRPTHA